MCVGSAMPVATLPVTEGCLNAGTGQPNAVHCPSLYCVKINMQLHSS